MLSVSVSLCAQAWSVQTLPNRQLWRRSDWAVRTGDNAVRGLRKEWQRERDTGSQIGVLGAAESVATRRTADVCNKQQG